MIITRRLNPYISRRRLILGSSIGLGAMLLPKLVRGSTITAATGNLADVQAAVNSAGPGDTVQIPDGTWGWASTLFCPDGIYLRGVGTRDTCKIHATQLFALWTGMVQVDCKTGVAFRMSNLELKGYMGVVQGSNRTSDVNGGAHDQGMYIKGKAVDLQIFSCRFTLFGQSGITLAGNVGTVPGRPNGVIYLNEIIDIWELNNGNGVEVFGNGATSWGQTPTLGTSDAVYIESNTFSLCRQFTSGNNGCRYVARYNTCTDNYANASSFDMHGKAPSWPRGGQTMEIYNNTVNNSIKRNAGCAVRGGQGVVYNNDFVNGGLGVSKVIDLFMEDPGNNFAGVTDYPMQDQVGIQEDLYVWNNTIQSGGSQVVIRSTCPPTHTPVSYWLQTPRDYHVSTDSSEAKPGYTAFTYPHPLRPLVPPPTILSANIVLTPSGDITVGNTWAAVVHYWSGAGLSGNEIFPNGTVQWTASVANKVIITSTGAETANIQAIDTQSNLVITATEQDSGFQGTITQNILSNQSQPGAPTLVFHS